MRLVTSATHGITAHRGREAGKGHSRQDTPDEDGPYQLNQGEARSFVTHGPILGPSASLQRCSTKIRARDDLKIHANSPTCKGMFCALCTHRR